ncbi:hypothetical protein [Pseudomonas sp. S5D5]|uniref:hypothetical protein n=1 Tax=Pseudomonas sp. S5D5 TaxID=2083056 RepID=UPI000D0FC93D|nr:hypothetical protein [Pseudomonas sp. S5D5]
MTIKCRNEKGQFISVKDAMIEDFKFFISEYKRWAIEALRKGDRVQALEMKANVDSCRKELRALQA